MMKLSSYLLALFLLVSCQGYEEVLLYKENADFGQAKLYIPQKRQYSSIPLFVVLHGHKMNKDLISLQLGIASKLSKYNAAYILADGSVDSYGDRYWNATPGNACCDRDGRKLDHVGHLSNLIKKSVENYSIDPSKVFFIGFSNGSFMSYRMACEKSELIAGVIGLSGTVAVGDLQHCHPNKPLKIIHIHGEKDSLVKLSGGSYLDFRPYQDVDSLTNFWADRNGCDRKAEIKQLRDIVIPYVENGLKWEKWNNCDGQSIVEYYESKNGGHVMLISPDFLVEQIGKLLKEEK